MKKQPDRIVSQLAEYTTAFNEYAEVALLNNLLDKPQTLSIVTNYFESSDVFYIEKHRLIYEAIVAVSVNYEEIGIASILTQLRKNDTLEKAGGHKYLIILAKGSGYGLDVEKWCQLLKQEHAKRQVFELSLILSKQSQDVTTDSFDLVNQARTLIDSISRGLSISKEITLKDTCFKVLDQTSLAISNPKNVFLKWYIPELDRLLGGIRSPSADFWIVGGAAGCGKTALFIYISLLNAINGFPVGIVSLEMPREDLVRRMAVSRMQGRYTTNEVRQGFDNSGQPIDLVALQGAMSDFHKAPLYICDEGGLDIYRLTLLALDWKQRYGIRLLMIDYLQLIQDSTVTGSTDTARISSVSRKLKSLSKILDIPIIAISNLSKAADHSSDGRPHKQHLRESGQIEFDADGIMLLYRPWYHMISTVEASSGYPAVNNTRYLIQAQIEKNRNGPTDTVNMWADVATNRFFDQQPSSLNYTPF